MPWYTAYNFIENPFKITPNINLIGLEKQEENILTAIDSGDIFQLTGYTGSGKTSLMKKILTKLPKIYTPVYYDCSSGPAESFSMKALLTKKKLFGLVKSEYSKADKVVLLCDEVQKLDKNKTEEIKSYYDAEKLHAVIFSTIDEANMVDSMKSRIGDETHLSYPNKETLVKLVKNRLASGTNPFTDEALDELVTRSGNNPRIILINAEQVCKNYYKQHTAKKSITADLVKQVIKPEKDVLIASQKHAKGSWDPLSKEVVVKKEERASPKEVGELQKKLSPLQWDIVLALSKSQNGLGYESLVSATGKTKESLGKQLSRLGLISDVDLMTRKGITEPIVKKSSKEGKPHYDLVDEVRFLLARE